MVDIVFHIGLPKTATTTLQRQVFPLHSGFVGVSRKGPGLSVDRNAYTYLMNSVFGRSASVSTSAKERLADQLLALQKKRLGDTASPLVFSQQRLARTGIGIDSHPVVARMINPRVAPAVRPEDLPVMEFLEDFSSRFWKDGNVRVLLTLRSQPEWLASLYSQISSGIYKASQEDFEDQVKSIIDSGNRYLEWSGWVESLVRILGEENVCVLLMEEMGSAEYWKKLMGFLDFSGMDIERLVSGGSDPRNRKKEDDGSWKVLPFMDGYFSHHVARDIPRFSNRRSMIRFLAKRFGPLVDFLVSVSDRKGRGDRIQLTDEVRESLRGHVGQSNLLLGRQLEKDVASLGYPVP